MSSIVEIQEELMVERERLAALRAHAECVALFGLTMAPSTREIMNDYGWSCEPYLAATRDLGDRTLCSAVFSPMDGDGEWFQNLTVESVEEFALPERDERVSSVQVTVVVEASN